MLCTKEKNKWHEDVAIELALSAVFVSIGEVRPSATVIDKHKTSLNSIKKIISNDIHRWSFVNAAKIHIARRILLCHFHVMKAWSENLLTRIPEPDKVKIWHSLHVLMHCSNKISFWSLFTKIVQWFSTYFNRKYLSSIGVEWSGVFREELYGQNLEDCFLMAVWILLIMLNDIWSRSNTLCYKAK